MRFERTSKPQTGRFRTAPRQSKSSPILNLRVSRSKSCRRWFRKRSPSFPTTAICHARRQGARLLALQAGTDRKETRFDDKDRKALEQRWEKIAAETEKAVADLNQAGREFAQLLRVIQTRGDYAKEVLEAENAEAMVKVIQNLANDIRNGSEVLKSFIRTLTPPDS